MNKVDILAIGVHPDDVELSCSGTLMKSIDDGLKVGLCDLTQGELGTRGSAELRIKEAEKARAIIGADFRVNLGMADGFFENNEAHQRQIIEVVRACQPDMVLCNAPSDRHPDHGRSAQLTKVACFLSGLRKVETVYEGKAQEAWRPRLVLHYVQDYFLEPDLVIGIGPYWERKMQAVMAFSSQFYDPQSTEPMSSISSKEFLQAVEGRALQMGRYIGETHGEGFISDRPLGAKKLMDIL